MKRHVYHSLPKKVGGIVYRLENKATSHSHSGEPRTTIFSRLENKASPVTHILESQGQPFSALKTKQALSLTNWRSKDNHFQQAKK